MFTAHFKMKRVDKNKQTAGFCMTMDKNACKWLISRIYGIINPVFMKAHGFSERHRRLLLFDFRISVSG